MKHAKLLLIFCCVLGAVLVLQLVESESAPNRQQQASTRIDHSIFASGTGGTALTSTHYKMLGTFGEIGLPTNTTTISSANFLHQPGFLATISPPEMWTFMVFLNGDNDLDPWTDDLFNRLELVVNNPNVNIVVLWDRHPGGMWGDGTCRYVVQFDSNLWQLYPYTEDVNRWCFGELNMGDGQVVHEEEVGDIMVPIRVEDEHLYVKTHRLKGKDPLVMGGGPYNNQAILGADARNGIRAWKEIW